jgi:hypothetical protein
MVNYITMIASAPPSSGLQGLGSAGQLRGAAAPAATHLDRGRRRVLDGCLWVLEEACEQGQQFVSADVAVRMRDAVPAIKTGTRIRDAIDLVFHEQERVLRVEAKESVPRDPDGGAALKSDEARELTDRIKTGLHQTTLLLLEAHRRGAWQALGYRSWEKYVRQEFGFSRSRSYQLLDHGRVLQVLMTKARLSAVPDVSPYAAAQIMPRLEEVAAAVERAVTPGMGDSKARDQVRSVVEEYRTRPSQICATQWASLTPRGDHRIMRASLPAEEVEAHTAGTPGIKQLEFVLERVLELPDASELFGSVTHSNVDSLYRLVEAAARLTALADAWKRQLRMHSSSVDREPGLELASAVC